MNKIIIISLLAITFAVHGMQMPPRPNTLTESEKSHIEKLPGDLQRYLIPFIASTETLDQAIKNIQTLASINRHFYALINDPTNMENTMKLLVHRFKDADGKSLKRIIEKLEKLPMPGVQNNPDLKHWFKVQLIYESEEHARRLENETNRLKALRMFLRALATAARNPGAEIDPELYRMLPGAFSMMDADEQAEFDEMFNNLPEPLRSQILKAKESIKNNGDAK